MMLLRGPKTRSMVFSELQVSSPIKGYPMFNGNGNGNGTETPDSDVILELSASEKILMSDPPHDTREFIRLAIAVEKLTEELKLLKNRFDKTSERDYKENASRAVLANRVSNLEKVVYGLIVLVVSEGLALLGVFLSR